MRTSNKLSFLLGTTANSNTTKHCCNLFEKAWNGDCDWSEWIQCSAHVFCSPTVTFVWRTTLWTFQWRLPKTLIWRKSGASRGTIPFYTAQSSSVSCCNKRCYVMTRNTTKQPLNMCNKIHWTAMEHCDVSIRSWQITSTAFFHTFHIYHYHIYNQYASLSCLTQLGSFRTVHLTVILNYNIMKFVIES